MTQDKLLTMGLDEIDNFLNSSEGDFASFGDTIILDDDKLNQMTTDDYQVDLNVLDSTKDEVDDVDVINPFTETASETKALTKTELDDLFSDIIQDVNAKEVKKDAPKKTERKATAFKPADDFDIDLDEVVVKEKSKNATRKATTFKPVEDFDIDLEDIQETPKKATRKATAFKPVEDFDVELDAVVQEEPKKTTRKATAFSTSDEITDSDIEFMETEIETEAEAVVVEEKPKKQGKVTKKAVEEVEIVEEKPKKQRKTSKKKEEKVEVIEEQPVHAERILTEDDIQDIRTVIRDVIYKEVHSAFKDAIKNVANDLLGK